MQTDDYYVRNYNRDNDVCVWKQKNVGYYESSELSLFEIGVEKCTPGFDWGPDRKGFHTLHYVFSGKGSLMVNDRYFEISAGQVFYIAPNDFAYYKADAEMPWKYIWIRYFGTKASIIMNFTSLPDRFVMNDTADGFVNCSLNAILKAVMKDSSVNMYSLTGLLYCFLGGLVDRFPKKDTQIDSTALGYLDALIDYIHLNYANGALSSENFETLVYEPVDLYQQDVFAGVLGHSMYIPLADFEGSRWKDRVEVESGSGTTTPAATEPPAVSSDTKRSTDEPAKTDAATGEPTGTKQDVPAEKNFPVWIPVIAAAVVVAVIAVVVVVKKKTK